ncbi:MAG: nucleoside-diphosphate kinase [Rubrobacter sp.]|jgi:nucleoside-diphosphate kinase|nr:nucleoside-diphosphate kinase [Rubrobacter sp.]
MEQTLILVKPDGVKRKLAGEVISRIEAKNFDIREMKMMTVSRDLAEEHYGEHKDKPFFGGLVNFITSGPIVAMRVEGDGVLKIMRNIMGATNPAEAAPGTIRGDLALTIDENIVHGSDSPESAERELGLFFG